jgi:membrane fusion protein (multidrug efflux system)
MDSHEHKRRPRKVWVLSAIGVAVAAAVVVGVFAAQNARGNGSAKGKKNGGKDAVATPVELSRVGRDDISTFLETTTTLEPQNTAVLVARRQGQIVTLPAEEGDWVKQGQTLASLDDTEAQLALNRAKLASEVADRDLARGKQLKERNLISEKELDDRELAKRTAWQQMEQAKYDLTQTRVVAPFSGRVVRRMVNLGETVTPGKDCFEVSDFDPLLARVYFPERELARIKVGQPALLELGTQPGKEFPAIVSLVNPAVDRSNGTFKVTLEVRDPSGTLRPGSFARVRLRTGTFEAALVISRRALVSEDGDDFVFVARADSVNRVRVGLGAVSGDTAQILTGLAEGDSVVTVGQGGLKQGSKIKPVTF